jgi:hypothetical protein
MILLDININAGTGSSNPLTVHKFNAKFFRLEWKRRKEPPSGDPAEAADRSDFGEEKRKRFTSHTEHNDI